MAAIRIKTIAFLLPLLALLMTGCNAERTRTPHVPPAATYRATPIASTAPAEAKHIAVSHRFSLQAPADQIASLHQKHLDACRSLGCEVLSTSLDQTVRGSAQARTSVRIAPEAFPAFEKAISEAPAEVVVHTESAEDKSLPLLDLEKRLEAKTALRDRLTAMIRQPGQATITDLAAVERQIAEVQGDIEAATAQRDYLRTITETVRVDIDYSSISTRVAGINFSPVVEAISGGLDTFIGSAANVIVFSIATAPWIPLVLLAFWAIRRAMRRWRAR